MKSFFLGMLLIILSGVAAIAQPRYTLAPEPVCWTTPGGRDSSLTRIVLVTSPGANTTVMYLDQNANRVSVAGGSFQNCFCEDLPGWVYPPPGGISFVNRGTPTINPLDPHCYWTLTVAVEFPFSESDVTATFNGGAMGSIVVVGSTLVLTSPDILATCNDTPHTFVVSIVNAYGNASFTYEADY